MTGPVFTSATLRIPVHTVLHQSRSGTEPIRQGTLHFGDPRRAASLHYRYRVEIAILIGEKKLSGMIFSPEQKLSDIMWTWHYSA